MNIQTLEINGKEISYFVRKSDKAKRIIVRIDNKGNIELVVPRRVTYKEATDFIHSKKNWIAKHINRVSVRKNDFLFFGSNINIECELSSRNNLRFDPTEKILYCKATQPIKKEKAYEAWLKVSANEYIPDRVFYLAESYGFKVCRVTIRNQKTRWGSCTSKGSLSFNMNLMSFSKEIIDYVIVHELCHLVHMNHSKEYWELVSSFIPDYKIKRKILKERLPH